MRKLAFCLFIVGILVVSLICVVSAQNSQIENLTEKISETKEKINETIEEAKEETKKKIEEAKEKAERLLEKAEEEEKIILERIENEKQEFLDRLRNLTCSEVDSFRKCRLRRDCKNIFERRGRKKIWKNCTINPIYRALRAKKRIRGLLAVYKNLSECPGDCICTGSVTKCEIGEGRIMTVVAGKSGNIIIQTKNVNASTSVVLIKNKTGVFGNFSEKMKRLRYMPDQVRDKVLKKLKMRKCNCTTELLEDGSYEMEIERKYRIFGIFPRKKVVVCVVDAETGEIIRVIRPWWRFLAWKSKE